MSYKLLYILINKLVWKKLCNYKKVYFHLFVLSCLNILVINKFILSVAGKSKSCQMAEVIHFQFWSLKEKIVS